MAKSIAGSFGAFFISLLAISFFPTSSYFSKEPTIGFLVSNIEISSKKSSTRFCLLIIFLLIESSFSLKLTLLIYALSHND